MIDKLIGIHIDSTPDLLIKNIEGANINGANIVQFFVFQKNKDMYSHVKKYLNDNNVKCIIHASYTINLSQNWDDYSWWITQFINEIFIADSLNALYIVVHFGKSLELSKEVSINNMYSSLLYIYNKTKELKIKILIETSSGQGTELGYKLDELSLIYRKLSKHKNQLVSKKFGICIDTCHIFSAGYNIKNKEARDIYFDQFNELIGLNNIKLVHLNDSKVICGANVDRHENIGKGEIGKKSLLKIAKIFLKNNIPIILETPYKNIYDDLHIVKFIN